MNKKIYFMRHSKTDYHDQKKVLGISDIELNGEGISMVYDKLEEISLFGIECVVASNLKRAYQTAEIIAKTMNVPIIINNQIYERNQGILEGMKFDDVIQEYGEVNNITKIDGRESLKNFMKRVSNAINEICETTDKEVILIVAHSNVLRTFFQINGIRTDNWKLCDIKEAIYCGNGKWKMKK